MKRILLSLAHMGGNEITYIAEAFKDNWVVPLGPAVDEFERLLAVYLNKSNVVALASGTSAIHLALVMLGVGPGDEVICQDMTFAASANPIKYVGADPVFVGSEKDTWNMDPDLLEAAIKDRLSKTGKLPKAIIPVDLYGMPADMKRIIEIANKYEIPVIEDSAEALGSEYCGKKCGTFSQYGVLSFNGNKIITTSGGGALICPTMDAASRVLFYATQARENKPYYYHEHIGYNYRLSNISAAIGCGQMDVLDEHLAARRNNHRLYSEAFAGSPYIEVHENPSPEYNSNFWLTTVLFKEGIDPDKIRRSLAARNIESRLLWRPMSMMPVFADAPVYSNGIAENLFNRGLCLPSGSSLTEEEINRVIQAVNEAVADSL